MDRQHRTWRNTSEAFKTECRRLNLPCALCGQPIDYDASGRSRYGFTTDHITPLAKGGELLPGAEGMRPAHHGCNSKRGAGNRTDTTSRRW